MDDHLTDDQIARTWADLPHDVREAVKRYPYAVQSEHHRVLTNGGLMFWGRAWFPAVAPGPDYTQPHPVRDEVAEWVQRRVDSQEITE